MNQKQEDTDYREFFIGKTRVLTKKAEFETLRGKFNENFENNNSPMQENNGYKFIIEGW